MPLANLILSFTRKHSTVYSTFIETWQNLREPRDVEASLGRMCECLEYEQMRQPVHRCLEHFIDNEVAYLIYGLADSVSRDAVADFLARLVSLLPSNRLSRLDDFFNLLFSSKRADELVVALSYSERAVVFGCRTNKGLVEYALRFFFEEGSAGECARACIVYLLCSRETFEYLRRMQFIDIVVQRMNRMYLDLGDDVSLYLSLLQFVSYYAKKEADLYRMDVPGHRRQAGGRTTHARSPLLRAASGRSVFDLVVFPYVHRIDTYRSILENTGSFDLKIAVMDSVMANIENSNECILFVRECIMQSPSLVAPYLIKRIRGEWSPAGVFQKISGLRRQGSAVRIPRVCHVERRRVSIVDFLLDNAIEDDVVFLFMWTVCRETFYMHFGRIHEIFRHHATFWSDLWMQILG